MECRIINTLLIIFDSILASIFFIKVNGYRVAEKKKFMYILSPLLIFITILYNDGFELLLILICILISYLVMHLFKFNRVSKTRCFCSSLLYYISLMINNSIILQICYFLQEKHLLNIAPKISYEYIVMCIISKLALLFLIIFYIHIAECLENKEYGESIMVVIFNIIFNLLIIDICMNLPIELSINKNIMVILIMISVSASCFSSFYMYMKLTGKAKLEAELEIMKQKKIFEYKLFVDTKEYYEKIQRNNHDISNHLLHVSYCISNQQYDNALDYIKDLENNNSCNCNNVVLCNDMLNYIINYKSKIAAERGIQFEGCIENIQTTLIKDIDLCTLLGNILDNAIEAATKESVRHIVIEVFNYLGYEIYLIKNKISDSVLNKNRHLLSSKNDKKNHGYGMKQIYSIVEKYHGHIDIYEKDKFFNVKIIIPNNEK